MTGYCCVLNYCRKVSPLEGSKNRDSLLKKLVCVCVCGGGGGVRMDVHPCVCVWGYVQSPEATGVCGGVGGGGGGLNVHAFGYV